MAYINGDVDHLLFFIMICAIFVVLILSKFGVTLMKKLKREQKEHQIACSKKAMRRLTKIIKYEKRRNHYIRPKHASDPEIPVSEKTHVLSAPKEFSILGNMQGTIEFFNKVFEAIGKCRPHEQLYFNFSIVEIISADAIMYVIAILRNARKLQLLNIACVGNEPENVAAKNLLNKVGFYKYVRSRTYHPITGNNENIQISSGEHADGALAARICDFVHTHVRSNDDLAMIRTKRLYPMIIELMTNTKQHAYNEGKKMFSNWYIYVENKPSRIQFIFLDTGAGIPNTIRKTLSERILQILYDNDAKYIASALRGEFRTETKMANRGKGLPEIYENVKSERLCCLKIVSGKGFCYVTPDGVITEEIVSDEFNGTLFMWEIIK